jgi:simple sugar transport system permease protein
VSERVEGGGQLLQQPGGGGGGSGGVHPGNSSLGSLLGAFARQREATVLVVTVALLLYFGLTHSSTFVTTTNAVDLLSENTAQYAILAFGEVLLLICGEIDLSVGMTYTIAPFLMYYMITDYGIPAILAIILSLVAGLFIGWVNGFITVKLRVPSFITTLGTSFILLGLVLTMSHAEPQTIPASTQTIGRYIGSAEWSQITWAVIFLVILHIVVTRTKWGLHTIAVGGNLLGAREAGIHVARVKYGNFMICALLGAFVGLQVAFYTNTIDPLSGGYQPMFYAVTAAVIGGTAMLGGSGTILGAFLGALVISTLFDGFDILGISSNPLGIITGVAIIGAMIANVSLARLRGAGRTR